MIRSTSNRAPARPTLDELVRAHIQDGQRLSLSGGEVTVFAWSEAAIAPWQWTISRRSRERGPLTRPVQRGVRS